MDLGAATDDDLHAALHGSPIARTKLSGLRRNLSVARNNLPEQAADERSLNGELKGQS